MEVAAKEEDNIEAVYAPLSTVKHRGRICDQLYYVLYEAPNVLYKSVHALSNHIQRLEARGISKAMLVYNCPHVLQSTVIARVDMAIFLLGRFLNASSLATDRTQVMTALQSRNLSLSLLVSPFAKYIRLHCYSKLLSIEDASTVDINMILSWGVAGFAEHINTVAQDAKEAVETSSCLQLTTLERYYEHMLQHITIQLQRIHGGINNEEDDGDDVRDEHEGRLADASSLSKRIYELERQLCNLLNEVTKDMEDRTGMKEEIRRDFHDSSQVALEEVWGAIQSGMEKAFVQAACQ
jgi:hypothetical protein